MNKFMSMMKNLATSDMSFKQMIAVDSRLEIFTRAWCVAEISTANTIGMQQSVKLSSRLALDRQYNWLRSLSVRDMEASRVEDKAEILARIGDIDSFDRSLQKIIFEDLFSGWSELGTQDKLRHGGALVRWHCVADAHSMNAAGIWSWAEPQNERDDVSNAQAMMTWQGTASDCALGWGDDCICVFV